MARATAIRAGIDTATVWQRGAHRARRLRQEFTLMALLCVGLTLLVVGLYLVGPPELRAAILGSFLGFDQPAVTAPSHPPLSLSRAPQ